MIRPDNESLLNRYGRFKPLRLREIEAAATEMGITFNYAVGARRKFLREELDFWLDADVDDLTFAVLCRQMFFRIMDDLVLLKKDLHWKNKPARKDEITDEMKARAKAYPVTSLIEFHKGKALAFCHQDKTPSMSYFPKINKASCFVCNKRYDAIDVLVMRDGFTYHDAVRRLCGLT